MILELLILKITLDSVLQECNRLAVHEEARSRAVWLKSRLMQLRASYEEGAIDGEAYEKGQAGILEELTRLSKEIMSHAGGETNVEL